MTIKIKTRVMIIKRVLIIFILQCFVRGVENKGEFEQTIFFLSLSLNQRKNSSCSSVFSTKAFYSFVGFAGEKAFSVHFPSKIRPSVHF